jgi:hypothetical protein
MIKNILLCVLLIHKLSAQTFDPIQFKLFQPKWSHYSMANGLSKFIQGNYLSGHPILHNDYYYFLHNISDTSINQGYLIEKVNAKDGNLDWNYYKFFTKINTRELATGHKIIDDRYSVIIQKEIGSNPLLPGWWLSSYLSRKAINISDGTEISTITTDTNDVNNRRVIVPGIIFGINNNIFQSGDNYILLQQTASSYFSKFINKEGHVIDSFQKIVNTTFLNGGISTIINNEDSIYSISHTFDTSNGTKVAEINFYLFDYKLNMKSKLDLTQDLPKNQSNYVLKKRNSNCFQVISYPSEADISQSITVSTFNYNGNLLESFVLDRVSWNSFTTELDLNSHKSIIFLTKEEGGSSVLYFYKSDGKGVIKLVKKLVTENKDDLLLARNIYLSPKLDLLTNIVHISRKLQNNMIVPKWTYWALIDGADLELKTSINQISDSKLNYIYPNPICTGNNLFMSIPFGLPINYTVMDLNGRIITSNKEYYTSNGINISYLECGQYILNLFFNGKSICNIFQVTNK